MYTIPIRYYNSRAGKGGAINKSFMLWEYDLWFGSYLYVRRFFGIKLFICFLGWFYLLLFGWRGIGGGCWWWKGKIFFLLIMNKWILRAIGSRWWHHKILCSYIAFSYHKRIFPGKLSGVYIYVRRDTYTLIFFLTYKGIRCGST